MKPEIVTTIIVLCISVMLGLISSRIWDVYRQTSDNAAQIEHHSHAE